MELIRVYQREMPNGRVRLCAEASYDSDGLAGKIDEFYFEFPGAVQGDLVDDGNPWLALFLPISVVLNETLHIDKPVDTLLLEGCLEILEIWHTWMPELPVIDVEAETRIAAAPLAARTASFYSGGVDSMHTLLRHEDYPHAPRAEKIDDLITIFGIFGREKELVEQNRGAPMRARIDAIAARYAKQVIEVHTNIWRTHFNLTNSLKHSHGCLLAAVGLILGRRYSRILIPSSLSYNSLSPEGSHPLTDRLLSTAQTRMVQDSCDYTRFEKIAYLADHGHDFASLQVCSRDPDLMNCSACFKCMRAMLILESLGKLSECELFREPQIDFSRVARIYCTGHEALCDFEMAYSNAASSGREDLMRAINTLIARSAWLDASRRLIRRLREQESLSFAEIEQLSMLLGIVDSPACSGATRESLDNYLAQYPAMQAHLHRCARSGRSDETLDALPPAMQAQLNPVLDARCPAMQTQPNPMPGARVTDAEFRLLEHALLQDVICEHNLDIELRNPECELSAPNLIYLDGKAYIRRKSAADKY